MVGFLLYFIENIPEIHTKDIKIASILLLGLNLFLFNKQDVDVEDTMDELISRSLAKRYPPSKDQSYDTYGVHDLQVDYLKESQIATNGKSALKDLHKVRVLMWQHDAKLSYIARLIFNSKVLQLLQIR